MAIFAVIYVKQGDLEGFAAHGRGRGQAAVMRCCQASNTISGHLTTGAVASLQCPSMPSWRHDGAALCLTRQSRVPGITYST